MRRNVVDGWRSRWPFTATGLALVAAAGLGAPLVRSVGWWRATNAPVRIRAVPHQPVRCAHSHIAATEVSSARLSAVWSKLQPRVIPRWTEYVHAYRLWSGTAVPEVLHQIPFEQPLFDADTASQVFKSTIQVATTHGLIYRPWDPQRRGQGDSHVDYTLHVLAATGTPSAQSIVIGPETRTVADVVRAALANYSTVQEQEFTAVALARYLEPGAKWSNKHGQQNSLDDLCVRLCQQPLRGGACFGCHRLFALAYLLQLDDERRVLATETRSQTIHKLQEALKTLAELQREDGSWPASEFESQKVVAEREPSAVVRGQDARARDLSFAAHTLEWLALAPAEVSLDARAIEAACTYVVTEALDCPGALVEAHYPAFCHVGCALRDWYPREWEAFRASQVQRPHTNAGAQTTTDTQELDSP
jgi:hypothetical protein